MPPKKTAATLPTEGPEGLTSEISVSLPPSTPPVPIPRQVIEAEPLNTADRPKGKIDPFMVRVINVKGNLLFFYNARTDAIEFKDSLHDGDLYSIPLREMRAIAMSRIYSPNPQGDIVLTESGSYTTNANHAANEEPVEETPNEEPPADDSKETESDEE